MLYKEKAKIVTGPVLVIFALIVIIIFLNWQDSQRAFLNENTSDTAVVTDKYMREHRGHGMWFYVDAQHETVGRDGNKFDVIETYIIPFEDFMIIEVGDEITTLYNDVTGRRYVSFEKFDDSIDKICPYCGTYYNTEIGENLS